MTTLTAQMGTAVSNYWNSPPRALRQQIEYWLEALEKIPERGRSRETPVVLPNGVTTTLGRALDDLCLGFTCNQARGWDLSRYHQRLRKLVGYEPKNS